LEKKGKTGPMKSTTATTKMKGTQGESHTENH